MSRNLDKGLTMVFRQGIGKSNDQSLEEEKYSLKTELKLS